MIKSINTFYHTRGILIFNYCQYGSYKDIRDCVQFVTLKHNLGRWEKGINSATFIP